MPRSEQTYRRQLTSCLALAVACSVLSGCGQNSRTFLARLAGKPADAGHTLAGPGSMPRQATGTPDENAHPHLIRDPFLGQTRAGAIFQAAGQREDERSHDRGAAGRESTGDTASMTPPDQRAYLDGQLERLAAAMQEAPPRVPPQPEAKLEYPWAFGDPHTGHSTPVSPEELRRRFEQLASREPVGAGSRGWTSGGRAAGADRSVRPNDAFGSVPEELAPAPDSGESHLAMIVDTQLVPPRSRRRWSAAGDRGVAEFAAGPAFPTLPGDRRPQSPETTGPADASRRSADAGFGRTASAPVLSRQFEREQPVDKSADEATVLPAIELAMNVDAPGPAAPQVANAGSAAGKRSGTWRGPSDHAYRGSHAVDSTPRTLKPVEFGNRPASRDGAALSWFPGWLALVLGGLLVLLAGTALRRGAFRR